jgi:hypothetical protein
MPDSASDRAVVLPRIEGVMRGLPHVRVVVFEPHGTARALPTGRPRQ